MSKSNMWIVLNDIEKKCRNEDTQNNLKTLSCWEGKEMETMIVSNIQYIRHVKCS